MTECAYCRSPLHLAMVELLAELDETRALRSAFLERHFPVMSIARVQCCCGWDEYGPEPKALWGAHVVRALADEWSK